tara:strand:- start:32077 stop:32730 length:654 start_codon:yes stop_codon:yes gene_type:complete
MKKLICFSLWGEDKKYTIGALKNADLAANIYPGWVCRYYVGKSVPLEIVSKLFQKDNTEVFVMNEKGDWTSMFWRFLPASDDDIECIISRDTDSRLNAREKAAVDQWLDSGADFHIMRDHPYHATEILGGMWGVRGGKIKEMRSMILQYTKGDFWQVDQNFLKEKIYPVIKDRSFVHDPFFEKKPFPTNRNSSEFVGQAFNHDDTLCEPSHAELVNL